MDSAFYRALFICVLQNPYNSKYSDQSHQVQTMEKKNMKLAQSGKNYVSKVRLGLPLIGWKTGAKRAVTLDSHLKSFLLALHWRLVFGPWSATFLNVRSISSVKKYHQYGEFVLPEESVSYLVKIT